MTTYSSAVTNNNGSSGETSSSMKATNLVRFLNDPKDFSGQVIATRSERRCIATNTKIEHNPLVWLKKLERLRDLARLSDKDLLLIAADHLVEKAEIWFDTTCSTILSWSEFSAIFKKKYCTGLEDIWWSYIYNKKQQENESVEDVDIKLRELYSLLVGLKDEHIMIRHFMDAIHKAIAWEVERKSEIGTSSSLEDIVEAAIKAESVMKKYDIKYSHNHETRQGQLSEEYDSMDMDLLPSPSLTPKDGSAPSESSSAVKMDKLLEEFNELKISMLKIQSNNNRTNQYHNASSGPSAPAQNSLYPRSQVCFYCNQPGHIKTNCDQFKAHLADRHPTYPATGANTEPIGEPSGKGKDRQL